MERDNIDGSSESTNRRQDVTKEISSIEAMLTELDIDTRLPRLIPDIKYNYSALNKCSDNSKVSSTSLVPPLHNTNTVRKFQSKRYIKPVSINQDVKSIVEVDPQFYSMVANRPIKQKDDLRSYKNDIRKVLISRITKGYLEEELLKTEQAFDHEEACYKKALKNFNEQEKSFQKFLAHDHETAQEKLKQAREKEKELTLVTQEYENLAYKLAKVKSQITFINEGRLLLLSYEKFLHGVSPRQWKRKNLLKDYISIPTTMGDLSTHNIFKYDLRHIKTELESVTKPKLYFKTPNELVSLFEMLQSQNLFYLLIAEGTDRQTNLLFNNKEKMKQCFDEELGHSQNVLRVLAGLTNWLEMQAKELQKEVLRILSKHFREYVASETILKINTYVEFVYTRTVANNLTDMTALEMMQDLETEYNIIINDLESLDHDVVKSTEKKSFADDLLLMKRACKANEQLKNFTKVQNRLQKSYSLPINLPPPRCLKASGSVKRPSVNRVSTSFQNRFSK